MSCMNFDHRLLVNLEQSLQREFLRSNRAGAFASSSVVYCNTRKHHGLLICPIDDENLENHVLLSSLDETIVQEGMEFHLGIHKYPGTYYPLGHKYIEELGADPTPSVTYRIGSVILKKEVLLVEEEDQTLFRYTLIDCLIPITLRLQPFLAFRDVHSLTRQNMQANTKYEEIDNGIKNRMYEVYPYLHMQTSGNSEYTHAPSWFENIEYIEDQRSGEAYQEDLFVPGFFELKLKKGESVVFSASTSENKPGGLKRKFTSELKKRVPRNNYENCLVNAAEQFLRKRNDRTQIIAGYPYFGASGRDTLLALPGLTLTKDSADEKSFLAAIDTLLQDIEEGDIFEKLGNYRGKRAADTPLWFFWTMQKYVEYKGSYAGIWKKYGAAMQRILGTYRNNEDKYIQVKENGLIYASQPGMPLTWMDVVVDDQVMTPRDGFTVEINALWYNAICFAIEVSKKGRVKKFAETWEPFAEKVKESFVKTFWSDETGYLADHINGNTDWSIRPNMLFAASLPYSTLTSLQKMSVLDTVKGHLLAKKGLRTLSPRNPHYVGMPSDNRKDARRVYHQGNIFPWLFGHFIEALFETKGTIVLEMAKNFHKEFEKEMTRKGMGAVSEYFHGNPPHDGRGAISQAWNTAELLRIKDMIEKYDID